MCFINFPIKVGRGKTNKKKQEKVNKNFYSNLNKLI